METAKHPVKLEATVASRRLLPPIGAAILGLVILYGVGIAPGDPLHNAAHDTRHSAAFPCH